MTTDLADTRPITHIDDLTPDDRNANAGTPRGQAMLEASLQRLGAGRSILADRNGKLIAGNKTLEAAASLGLTDLLVVRTRGDQVVVVQREDLDLDSDDDLRARELALADNRVQETNLSWDSAALAELEGMGVDLEQFWSRHELDRLLEVVPEPEPAPDAVDDPSALDDQAPDLLAKWDVRPGDAWAIPSLSGRRGAAHRVACGHPADRALAHRLLGAQTPLLLLTEPPVRLGAPSDALIDDDVTMDDWTEVYDLWDASVVYCWHRPAFAVEAAIALRASGYRVAQQLIWSPGVPIETSGHYQLRHLACWYALHPSRSASWAGDRQQTVWTIRPRGAAGRRGMRPVDLLRPALRHHTPKDALVVDPFAGMGGVLIAAELEGRPAICVENDPLAVAVMLERATSMGLTPAPQKGET